MMANFPLPYRVTLAGLLPEGIGNAVLAMKTIAGLDHNSATVEPGDLFFACPGIKHDGRRYIDDAVLRGAAVVLYEAQGAKEVMQKMDCVDVHRQPVTMIPVDNLAQQISAISARYFHQPSQQLHCIGVTGTNGKTSCAFWIAHLLQKLGNKTGLIGTLGYQVLDGSESTALQQTGFTTPDAIRLQQLLSGFREQQVTHAVMEVSSHSLEQGRVNAVRFSSALFTNLSRDHLDYHGSLEAYATAKAKLFAFEHLQHAVINLDDALGAALATQSTAKQVMTYSLRNSQADVHVRDLQLALSGISGELVTPQGSFALSAPVIGEFNVSNLLGVIAVLCCEGFAVHDVLAALAGLDAPPGRLQRVSSAGDEISVFVDFAHTPDALEKLLAALRPYTGGQLWCVFGCGGDRDRGKRPLMGQIVSSHADRAVVTSDNPRSEYPQAIIAEITAVMDGSKTIVVADRRQAIQQTIREAMAGDVIVIAGKGHEDYQEANGIKVPFSDAQEVVRALANRRGQDGRGQRT
jgi:UDP-N-acetylmuramoyl-L-alanyl-D-glutamate--2,6-diaminopimelate ligase